MGLNLDAQLVVALMWPLTCLEKITLALTASKPTKLACLDHISVQTVRGDFHS